MWPTRPSQSERLAATGTWHVGVYFLLAAMSIRWRARLPPSPLLVPRQHRSQVPCQHAVEHRVEAVHPQLLVALALSHQREHLAVKHHLRGPSSGSELRRGQKRGGWTRAQARSREADGRAHAPWLLADRPRSHTHTHTHTGQQIEGERHLEAAREVLVAEPLFTLQPRANCRRGLEEPT